MQSSFSSLLFSQRSALALTALAAFSAAVPCPVQAQDAVNVDATPSASAWAATEVGWDYMPTTSYSLNGIETKFSGGDPDREVTVALYSAEPSFGGALLRSATFTPASGTFSGASFAALHLAAGQNYFVGFRNVGDLGVNVTSDSSAAALSVLHYDFYGNGNYDSSESGDFTNNPILRFDAAPVPEAPTTVSLGLLLALGGLVIVVRRRRVSRN